MPENENERIPNPGSQEAKAMGCTCPVVDNNHGRGLFNFGEEFGWVVNQDCAIHTEIQQHPYQDPLTYSTTQPQEDTAA